MSELLRLENVAALLTLTAMEIVLGIDNIVFLAIITGRLPVSQQPWARRLGLALAMLARILLLLAISWILRLQRPLLEMLGRAVSGRDLILLAGGLFLIAKATYEIHEKIEDAGSPARPAKPVSSLAGAIVQIVAVDAIFSLDSVLTAIGMARAIPVMVAAIILAVTAMLIFARAVCAFIERHPTVKMLALAFLLLIGVMLVADGLGRKVEKGYIYFAMSFSLFVEMLNLRLRRRPSLLDGAGGG
jgi:predicted tellurium resistance membrane protein TerC